MTKFEALEKRMSRDVGALHDFLWSQGWKGDAERLRTDLLEETEDLDSFLGAEGTLLRNAQELMSEWGRGPEGEALFELLHHTYSLTAATELVKNREYQGAAALAADVAESVSIGISASAGHFPIVQEWEGGKIDFMTYAGRLAGVLEQRGIESARNFQHLLMAAENIGKEWDWTTSREARMLAAEAAIANAAWCAVAGVSIREALGQAPSTPYQDMPALILRIAARVE